MNFIIRDKFNINKIIVDHFLMHIAYISTPRKQEKESINLTIKSLQIVSPIKRSGRKKREKNTLRNLITKSCNYSHLESKKKKERKIEI